MPNPLCFSMIATRSAGASETGHPIRTENWQKPKQAPRMSYDIVIVGAGIVGAACAAECARAGLKVLVLDRGSIGGGTTAAGMCHIVVMDDSEAQFALTSYSRNLWSRLAAELPADVEY